MTRIGINGFGRMGRLALRAAWGDSDLSIVAVNELKGGPATAAHLLEFDSVHGRWDRQIKSGETGFSIEGHEIAFSEAAKPADVPWDDYGVEIVLECTGKIESVLHAGCSQGNRRRSRQARRRAEYRHGGQ